jgi:16S rRNA (guanine(1405)-N(7))-methyltransferase
MPDDPLDRLVAAVRQSAKHGRVAEDLIRRIGADEVAKRRNLKAAIKATKNKLHQVGGAFLDVTMDYAGWLDLLADAAPDRGAFRDACRAVMRHHASTRERLPILDEFYATTLAEIAPVRSVLDVACGLNPLAIPWMPLAPGATYCAIDIYRDMVDFLNGFFRLIDLDGQADARDIGQNIPSERADVALLLKTIPCLEHIDRAAGRRLLDGINAEFLLVSFPARSLGGYDKGMVANYEAHVRDLLAGREWPVKRFEFETELAFLIEKRSTPGTLSETQ